MKNGAYVTREQLSKVPSITLSKAREEISSIKKSILLIESIYGEKFNSDPKILLKNPYSENFAKGFSINNEYLYLGENFSFRTHELVHLKDNENNYMGCVSTEHVSRFNPFNIKKNLHVSLVSAVLEGRATFATQINSGKLSIVQKSSFKAKRLIWKQSKENGLNPLITVSEAFYPFVHNALVKISEKIGDPIFAFRMVTDKPPTWFGLFFPIQYYRKEIEKISGIRKP